MNNSDRTTLKALLLNSARGDSSSFGGLYDLTSPRLYALAIRITGDHGLAQDVLQEAYVQIWYGAGEYHAKKGEPMAWMAGIVRFRALDIRRKEKNQQSRIDGLAAEVAGEALPVPEDTSQQSEELQQLLHCMKEIQGKQRESILMSYYYGYSHSELALKMKQPIGTIKTWIRRGLSGIRSCLRV